MENEKDILENEDTIETVTPESTETEASEIPETLKIDPEVFSAPEQKKSSTFKVVLITVVSTILALALLGAMVYLVLKGAGILERKPEETEPTAVTTNHTYTVDDATIVSMTDNVVAKAGGMQMTNAELQMYYESSIISYQQNYGMYLMYMGVDLSQPLDTQIFDDTTGQTWQDIILDSALQTWHACVAVKQYADADGYTPDEEGQAYLAGIDDKIQEMVTASGCTSAEQLIKEQITVGATVDALRTYMEMDFYYADYVEYLREKFKLSDEELEKYYSENEEKLSQEGISKENGDVVDVRHVLIMPESGTTDENNKTVYSDEEWENARVKAQELYDAWLAGDANEDTFAQLAKDNSVDGNASDGGLYTGVTQGYMVEEFDSWIFDESRQFGDSGIVKTQFGYHIMFFVKREAKWIAETQIYAVTEAINKVIKKAMETYALETYMDQVGVSH